MKILIAEDDDVSRKSLAKMLQNLDHDVVVTSDGSMAWQKMQEPHPPQLLVLDIMMPKIDGLELCRKIREHNTDNPPYIILLTAKTERDDVVRGLESGANDYVCKPCDFDELKARIAVGERMLRIQANYLNEIYERKQAEEELRLSEERYKKLFYTNPDAVALVDTQGKFIMVNPSMVGNFGMTPEELNGKRFHEVMPQDLAETRIAWLQEALQQDGQLFYEDEREGIQFHNYIIPIDTSGNKRVLQIIARDVTDQKNLQERLMELSIYDSLTKLYSRYLFEEEMKRLGGGRYCPIAIIICDIDGLKLVNDTLGHHIGDTFLINTANILRRAFRSSDIISRIGGDEFAVLLPRCTEDCIRDCKDRIKKEVEEYNRNNEEFGLSVSIGHAIKFQPPVDMKSLFKKADDAMYKEKLDHNSSSSSSIVQALIKAVGSKDHFSEERTERLYHLVKILGKAYGLVENKINNLCLLAKFHDFGEVGISNSILCKQEPLSEDEYREVKKHCEIGQRIALFTTDLAPIADLILKHHEWWNGQGYPLGLKGEDIPLECRIMAIVDAYDSMTSGRPYKQKISQKEALMELRRCAGTQFDPELVELFIQTLPINY